MQESQISDYPKGSGATFENVWDALMEYKKRQEEDRIQREEDWKKMQESSRKTDKQLKELGKRMGYLNNSFGELAEHLVAPGIGKRFNELGYHFGSMAPGGYRIIGKDGKDKTEIDILLENDDVMIAVEVKVKPNANDVEHHIGRLKILREYRNSRNDTRKILGAIAGAVFDAQAKAATIEAGMYVIEQSGDTMKIDVPDGFIPAEW